MDINDRIGLKISSRLAEYGTSMLFVSLMNKIRKEDIRKRTKVTVIVHRISQLKWGSHVCHRTHGPWSR